MGEVYPLDSVIQQIAPQKRAINFDQKIVIIETKTGKEKRSLFARDVQYYLISNTKGSGNFAEHIFDYQVSSFEDDFEVGLSIKYRVSCDPGKEVKVAEALWNNNHPAAELERRVKKYIDDFFAYASDNEITDLVNNYSKIIKSLQKHIVVQVKQEIGLNIQLKISLDGEDDLRSVRFSSSHFPVQFRDYSERLDLKFEIEISIDENNKANALLHSLPIDKLEKIIQKEIKKYLLENISAEEFYSDLDTNIRLKLIWHLDKVLGKLGRQVAYLSLKSDVTSTPVKDFLEIEHEVRCYAQEEKVVIKNNIQMMPESIGKYRMAKSPSLERWVEKNLDTAIKSILFDKKYVDILLDFDPIKQDIRDEIVERAKDIGYAIKQIISVPDLEPLKLQKQFSIEFQETFETKQDKVKVKLNVVVNAKIENLRKIEDLINSRTDVKAAMQDAIKQNIRSFLHTIEPERFYMRFFSTDRPFEEKLSLEQELVSRITSELEKEPFYAKVISVIPKNVETDITERFDKLQTKLCSFEFEVNPLKLGEPVCFQGAIQVERIHENSWYIFQSRKYEIEEIRNQFIEHIKPKLATKDYKVLQYTEEKDLSGLERILNKWGNDFINEQFGLVVKIINISRKLTSLDVANNQEYETAVIHRQKTLEQRGKKILAPLVAQQRELEYSQEITATLEEAKKTELQKLIKKRETLMLREGNTEEIKQIEDQIWEIEQMVNSSSLEISEEPIDLLKPEQSAESSFSEIAETMGLPESNSNPKLNSAKETIKSSPPPQKKIDPLI